MGPESRAPGHLRDPRILIFDYLPNARFLTDGKQVAAVLVGAADEYGKNGAGQRPGMLEVEASSQDAGPKPAAKPGCTALAVDEHQKEILRAARMQDPKLRARVVAGCFGGGAVALAYTDRRLALIAGEPGKLRRAAVQSAPKLTFAGPLDIDGDGRTEIGAVSHTQRDGMLTVRVEVFRYEGGKLARLAAQDAYKVTAVSATWIGARLDQIDLLLEINARLETLYLGGLYVQRSGQRTHNVAPLLQVKVPIRPKRPAPAPAQPGASSGRDAGAAPAAPAGRKKVDAGAARKAKPAKDKAR
jgi:hypothetical protein